MNSESLQTLSTAAMLTGFVFTGLGGFGFYYFGRSAGVEKQPERVPEKSPVEAELRTRLEALQKTNEELRGRIAIFEREAEEKKSTATATPPSSIPTLPTRLSFPSPPAPVSSDWAGSSLLEEMIEASVTPQPKISSGLNESQQRQITTILAKYADRNIDIHSVANDAAGFNFAQALKRAFEEAKWRVTGMDQIPYAKPPVGLFISSGATSPPEEAIIPHEALTAAGFKVSRQMDSKLRGDKTVLLVGVSAK